MSINKLISLASFLDSADLEAEAFVVDTLIKESAQPASQVKAPPIEPLRIIIKALGLTMGNKQGVELVHAALYLAEGVNNKSLLLAGLSITSLVPGLQDVSKLLTAGANLDQGAAQELGKLILDHKDVIKVSFLALKNPAAANSIRRYILHGKYLPDYSDRMFETVRSWALKTINTSPKEDSA